MYLIGKFMIALPIIEAIKSGDRSELDRSQSARLDQFLAQFPCVSYVDITPRTFSQCDLTHKWAYCAHVGVWSGEIPDEREDSLI